MDGAEDLVQTEAVAHRQDELDDQIPGTIADDRGTEDLVLARHREHLDQTLGRLVSDCAIEIVDAITEEGISFGSILVARYWEEDKRAVFPYLLTQNISRVKRKLTDMGFTLLEPMEWYLDQLPKHD